MSYDSLAEEEDHPNVDSGATSRVSRLLLCCYLRSQFLTLCIISEGWGRSCLRRSRTTLGNFRSWYGWSNGRYFTSQWDVACVVELSLSAFLRVRYLHWLSSLLLMLARLPAGGLACLMEIAIHFPYDIPTMLTLVINMDPRGRIHLHGKTPRCTCQYSTC